MVGGCIKSRCCVSAPAAPAAAAAAAPSYAAPAVVADDVLDEIALRTVTSSHRRTAHCTLRRLPLPWIRLSRCRREEVGSIVVSHCVAVLCLSREEEQEASKRRSGSSGSGGKHKADRVLQQTMNGGSRAIGLELGHGRGRRRDR